MRQICLAVFLLAGCYSSSGQQGPPGPQGDPGPAGPAGAMGTMGTMGAMGTPGTTGSSVTIASLPVGDAHCANGGTSLTVGSTATYACNGGNGSNGSSATVTSLSAGDANCPNGGTKITAGAVSSFACNGGNGTFTGTFSGTATFTGTTQLNGTTTFAGLDLFNAAWQGVYPAVLASGGSDTMFCGPAPTTINVVSDTTVSAAYGRLLNTFEGMWSQGMNEPWGLNCPATGTEAWCWGPVTFFLNNPGAAKSISIPVLLDDGPSFIYVDGNLGANKFISAPIAGMTNASVNIPSGPFALSVIACSNNGPSINFQIQGKFITANNLTLDYERTFHKGK